MNLKISKPICFFDLETTGVNVSSDRIVEISILKIFPNGNKESKTWLVNPEIPIPLEASNIHGITNDKVKALKDMNYSEFITLMPLLILVILLGVYPNIILDTISISVENLVSVYNSKIATFNNVMIK